MTGLLRVTESGVSRYVHDSTVKDQEVVVAVDEAVVTGAALMSCYHYSYSLASPIEREDSLHSFQEYQVLGYPPPSFPRIASRN